MAKMRVLLSGYYGKGNGGDEALLATLLQMLPLDVTPVVLSGNPEETHRHYGVECYNRMAFFSVFKALRSCGAFVWGGGSLIQDCTSIISPFYYGGLMALAQVMGLKTVAWGQGIGPLLRSQTRFLAQRNFAGCTQVSVRDIASSRLLSDWSIPHILAPDPVWALESKPVPELVDLPKPRIAVTLRNHPQLTENRLTNLIQALVNLQKETQTFILLLPFQKSEDLGIAEKIHTQLKDVSRVICSEDPQVLKGVFRGVEMSIGMRLHSLIMAASEGSRCFALSYDPKVNHLMEDLKIPGWDLHNLPNDVELISKTWIDYYHHGESLSDTKIQSLVNGAFLHRDLLSKVLK
ncbi:MAG: polysaccharide pyruvyl transferase [Aphanizomenon flos-aquae LD13]|jgi:polysaccharide pyruvyl transferase CsaB|uniref:Polysaccharide pyruvyl transferase n=1 Tax=Aphanizomenon flos-aquae LD13 TaxID=1710894 RepID=A0A1B7VWQ9_APHFL|nr:polysaccharide pyruvyl transferase CsaB [Aphanizomenon flos-aquae UKL13-PB]OBQ25349.1 MAG: polysaccharide pyruvyl transferase [Aphanizomenon flos-aquae LD13]HCQ21385.1 polysaccharide pyruvyl transferase CsaB [Anabaena sp. UBA12330]